MSVLVTSADSIKALVAVRSLGQKDIKVNVADEKKNTLAAFSKYSKKKFTYESPQKDPIKFIRSLDSILRKNHHDVLLPIHSNDTYIISEHKNKLEKNTIVPLDKYSTICAINNKGSLMKTAEELNIPAPKTYYPDNLDSIKSISKKVTYPAVIKLRESASSIGLSYANSESELRSVYKDTVKRFSLKPDNYPLIQEYITGIGYGVSLLFNHGDVRAKFVHKRIREHPIDGGPSTYRISTENKKMEKYAIELLKHYDFHGVAMVEFKWDGKAREPSLMEINPRFWGSINQAVSSGVDFPYLLYRMGIDGDVDPVMSYKLGVKTRNIFIDKVALIKYFRKTGKAKYLGELFSLPRNDDIISIKDPLPVLPFIKRGIGEIFNSRYK